MRRIDKNGTYHGRVVNVDGTNLGEHRVLVFVKQDAVNNLYVEKNKVLEALAKTQNGMRPRPKKDHGPFNRGERGYFLPRARELFSKGGYDRVYARELGRLLKEDSEKEDEDEDLEDEDEEDAANELRYARSNSLLDVDSKAFPEAKKNIYFSF